MAWPFEMYRDVLTNGDVAQLVEHLLCKQGVVGSIPSISTSLVLGWINVVTGMIEFQYFAAQFL